MEELGFHWPSLVVYVVNFTILLAILYVVGYKPILRILDQRSERIRGSLEEAEHIRKESEERQRAREEAKAFLSRAREDIQRETDNAMEELRQEFADLAISAAERVIERSLDKQAHNEIIDKVLEESSRVEGGR